MNRRIAFVQYTNPGGYPPLEHAAHILAESGWDVLFLGTGAFGSKALTVAPHHRIEVRQIPYSGSRWSRPFHFSYFMAWVLASLWRWRPSWLYLSDTASTPVCMIWSLVSSRNIVYHEHDTPCPKTVTSLLQRLTLHTRRVVARKANLCVVPQVERLNYLLHDTATTMPAVVVHNCPRLSEAVSSRSHNSNSSLALYFHGSVGPHRLPLTVLRGIAETQHTVHFHVVGYETVGNLGFFAVMKEEAKRLGISCNLHIHPPRPRRRQLWPLAMSCDVGVVCAARSDSDLNLRYLAGASNKAFDYLAAGLALLVPDTPEWRAMYVDPGYARSFDPEDAANVAEAFEWLSANRDEVRLMAERGRQRILTDWNYETQFAPVKAALEADMT